MKKDTMQLSIDFAKQNSPDNQAILDANADLFKGQCLTVYRLLKDGFVLTTSEALRFGIGDLRARARDLIKAGVPVQKRLIKGRYKEYFL